MITLFKSPLSILVAAMLGVAIGINYPGVSSSIKPWGEIYFTALKMTIIPFVFTSVSVSMAGLTQNKNALPYTGRILFYFSLFLVLTGVLSVLLGHLFQPGVLSEKSSTTIIDITSSIPSQELFINEEITSKSSHGIVDLFVNAVPENIFNAFSQGKVFQIIVFSIILGAAIGFLSKENRSTILPLMSSFKVAIQKIISALMVFLPFGVLTVFAEQTSAFNIEIVNALLSFVGLSILVFVISYFLSLVFLSIKSGLSIMKCMSLTREALFIVISTGSSFIALPRTEDVMINDMKFSKKLTPLVMPLGLVLCRYSYVTYFAFAALFIAQIYSFPLSLDDMIFIVFGAVIASIASSGAASGLLAIPFITIITDPLGLPFEASLVLLLAVDPIFEPFRSAVVLFNNMVVSAIITGRDKDNEGNSPQKKIKQKGTEVNADNNKKSTTQGRKKGS